MSTSRKGERSARSGPRGGAPAALLLACACAVGPDYVRPDPPAVERYTAGTPPASIGEGQPQRLDSGAAVVGDWWTLFRCQPLDAVVRESVPGNQALKAAEARLRESQDILRAGHGVFFPQIDAGGSATRQRVTPARFGTSGPATHFNLFTLSASVSYVLDVFGGQRRTVEALSAQVDSQRYLVIATYLTLTTNVVNTTIAAAAYRDQIAATEALLRIQREQVSIAEAQAAAGTAPYVNVLGLQAQLASVEATLPPLRQRLSQAEHLLATLAGRTPAEAMPAPLSLGDLALPADLPVTLPSVLVRQRPDVLAAEAELHVASAEIGVATAALLPSFTLTGSFGSEAGAAGDLLRAPNPIWSLGAGVTAPLFHGGSLWYRRKAAIEGYEASLASYRQTVLDSFAQVADVLRALQNDADLVGAQSRAVRTAEEALRLVDANFRTGVATYLQVLVASGQYHQARIGHLQAVAQRLQDTVALFAALGGGWWDRDRALVGPAGRP